MWTRMAAGLMVLTLAGGAAGCRGQGEGGDARTVSVVATFHPLAEFARGIGGVRVAVRTLVPPGVEPHNYEPAPRDLAALERAQLFVYNGAGLEPWVERVLPDLPARVVRVNASVRIVSYGRDPHVWLDPALAALQVEAIRAGLVEADPVGRVLYDARAAALQAELEALRARYAEVLAGCQRREFVTSHAAFGYLAARFGLREVPISGVEPEAEPSPARLREIIAFVRTSGTTVIYAEPLTSDRVVQAVARETGAQVMVLDPLEGQTAAGYVMVMSENLDRLAEGLDCRR